MSGGQRPQPQGGCSQGTRGLEPSASRAICPEKVRVTELAYRIDPVLLPATPEIASRKPAEDGRPAGVDPFPLDRIIELLDEIGH
jgi:hypothetical protein